MTVTDWLGTGVAATHDRAARVDARAVLLLLVTAPFLALGFVARRVVVMVWLVASWMVSAVLVGWDRGAPGERRRPRP